MGLNINIMWTIVVKTLYKHNFSLLDVNQKQ